MPDLKKMLEHRQKDNLINERDFAYQVFDAYINSRRSEKSGSSLPQLTYKPFSTARFSFDTPNDHKLAINLSRRVHSYFTSTFSKVPSVRKVARDPDEASQKTADRITLWLDGVFSASRVKAAQPRAASWLSNRGDTVFGVDWDDTKKEIFVRTWDPQWCYPTLHPFDLGGCTDMLITFATTREWAEQTYGVTIKNRNKTDVQVFFYWDDKERVVQVEEAKSTTWSFEHKLGRCPFRWVFGNADGMYAQSDIRDVPALQDFYNENLILAMDTIRKQVDKAWIGFGFKKNIKPIPGMAVAVPQENAKLQEFDAGGDPHVIMSVMDMLESGIESSTGISPVSSRGRTSGSPQTGSAVRSQVSAMEARNEARKAAFEDAYEQVGVLCLQVLEKCIKGAVKTQHRNAETGKNGYVEVSGEDIDGHYLCEAVYSGFLGASLAERVQYALQGLGRLYGLRTAVGLADIPGVNPASVEKEIDAYQENLAITAARGQAIAQKVAQSAEPSPQQGGQAPMPPGAMPQRAQPAPPPGPQEMGMTTLGDIERTLEAVQGQLHGSVWAIGELAIAGVAASPLLMVGSEKDLGVVTGIMSHLRTAVLPGHPGDMPNLLIA